MPTSIKAQLQRQQRERGLLDAEARSGGLASRSACYLFPDIDAGIRGSWMICGRICRCRRSGRFAASAVDQSRTASGASRCCANPVAGITAARGAYYPIVVARLLLRHRCKRVGAPRPEGRRNLGSVAQGDGDDAGVELGRDSKPRAPGRVATAAGAGGTDIRTASTRRQHAVVLPGSTNGPGATQLASRLARTSPPRVCA